MSIAPSSAELSALELLQNALDGTASLRTRLVWLVPDPTKAQDLEKVVAKKVPDKVLQEDEMLLLWYDQALTRMEEA